jgi:hypothetical protein
MIYLSSTLIIHSKLTAGIDVLLFKVITVGAAEVANGTDRLDEDLEFITLYAHLIVFSLP